MLIYCMLIHLNCNSLLKLATGVFNILSQLMTQIIEICFCLVIINPSHSLDNSNTIYYFAIFMPNMVLVSKRTYFVRQ